MAVKPINPGLLQFYDPNTGKPVAGGFVATYDTISNSPKVTYKNLGATVENPNPVPLDATGSAYIFGEGTYNFVVKNAAGVTVRNLNNIGVDIASGYEVSSDTEVLGIGGGNQGYDGDDLVAIYSGSEPHQLIGFGNIDEMVLMANVNNENVAGDYETVSTLYTENSAIIPDGTKIWDDPQPDYQQESTRVYEFKSEGSFAVDPQSDTNVSQWGDGDNYKDLMRFAAAEELRLKRAVMYWDKCNDLIGQGDIEYPVMVIGSDGRLYATTGSPSAELMKSTDPVTNSNRDVWSYVYDPTETAQYPPWYRSPNQGVKFISAIGGTAVDAYPQSCKLLEEISEGVYEFTNDGKLTENYYKKPNAAWVFGTGTDTVPVGGAVGTVTNGWYNVYLVKTTGGDVDVCISNDSIADVCSVLNGKAAEISAGRVWKYARRIAYVLCETNEVVQFYYNGNGVYRWKTRFSVGTYSTGLSGVTVGGVPPNNMGIFGVQGWSPKTTGVRYALLQPVDIGVAVSSTNYNIVAGSVDTSVQWIATSNMEVQVDGASEVYFGKSGDWFDLDLYTEGFRDTFED